ncbi:MAG: hypothetical protein GXP08_07340 [Gammaproteobacteria bacterium]|nr:hypothetical protein [Gammaproteobacteria bacterium]
MTSATTNDLYLIATSDDWLAFIIEYRSELEAVYKKIFHPENESLAICVEKKEFSLWCQANEIPAPKIYSSEELYCDEKSIKYPLFIRPAKTRHSDKAMKVPKALEVKDLKELQTWLDCFASEGVEALVTESLLNQNLVQYSVAAVRTNNECVAYVTVKTRPTASACAVGTYVELRKNRQIEQIGIKTLTLLNYYGIAEVEILHSLDTGKNYVIEVNARPWVQYALGLAAGYDFLKFLLQPNDFNIHNTKRSGKYWIDLKTDFYTCFSKNEGLVRHKKISKSDYLLTLLKANVFATFSFTDIKPFLFELKEMTKMIVGK